jgi:gluconokinase
MGAAGAGKTTIGRALAAELGWTFVEGDDYHPARNVEKMHAGTPLDDADRAPWLAALHTIAVRALDRREGTVIACSALRRRYREILRGDRHRVRFVYLRAADPELQRRLTTRPGHFAGPSLLQSQIATLESPAADEALTVDATSAPERILGAIRAEFGV